MRNEEGAESTQGVTDGDTSSLIPHPSSLPKLWGGRFDKASDETIEAFTASLPFDRRMALHDVRGSIAHVRMLGHCNIIPAEDAQKIEQGLPEITGELESGALEPHGAEDIHSFVEQ